MVTVDATQNLNGTPMPPVGVPLTPVRGEDDSGKQATRRGSKKRLPARSSASTVTASGLTLARYGVSMAVQRQCAQADTKGAHNPVNIWGSMDWAGLGWASMDLTASGQNLHPTPVHRTYCTDPWKSAPTTEALRRTTSVTSWGAAIRMSGPQP